MKYRIAQFKAGLATLEAFAEKYPLEIPEGLFSAYIITAKPELTIWVHLAPNEHGRLKLLSVIGDSFGREGWVKSESPYSRERFNWKREIDGVAVSLEGAETIPERQINIPVPVSAWPILIEESAVA